MLWDLLQQGQIAKSQGEAEGAGAKADLSLVEINQLKNKVDGLSLACQAMWEILSEKSGVSENELLEKITEIDLRDGQLDGKLRTEVLSRCGECGNKIKNTRPNCFWCGAKTSSATPFIK